MENKLVSSWWKNVQSLPESYKFPLDQRHGEPIVPLKDSSPIIDLITHEYGGYAQPAILDQIIKASQDFGYFQGYFSTSYHCHPLQDYLPFWPEKPTHDYREVISAYSIETRKLITKILDVISEGLGLEKGYFGGELSKVQMLSANYYPPCPDPNLALGMHSHCDPNLFTILLQDSHVYGLQIFKDGKWIAVEPIPNAFVVIIGCQLQIISNDRLKSVVHRAVTNSKETRICVGNFVIPSSDCHIEPATYKPYQYKEFLHTYAINHGDFEDLLQSYKL
ncbi:hypothetical protein R3W88_005289 [Solanum pinnatisectum]|uniref:Fe2OG dioxygenase domain-containing protein n=1 Tax=Solanum pinnatisectum TaxID=50273 RepID=A0AAV9KBQ8_9SOLN|nr:hypothetical protein R3W88_005289 [Solanum pinnatisectum]